MTIRAQILEVLEDGPALVEQIVEQIGSTAQCVSVTLGQLRQLGIVQSEPVRREGKRPRNMWSLGSSGLDDMRIERRCMTCRQPFRSEGNHNRICKPCKNEICRSEQAYVAMEVDRW